MLRTSEGIWEHAPRKNYLKIMSFEVHLEKNCFQNILKILTFFQDIDIVSKRLLGAFSGMRPDDVDGAMHFIYSHKYNTNSAEDSSDMN